MGKNQNRGGIDNDDNVAMIGYNKAAQIINQRTRKAQLSTLLALSS